MIDGRMLGRGVGSATGTGVSSYARALMAAAERAGYAPALLDATRTDGATARAGRWLAAATARTRPVREAGRGLIGDDVFRIAQNHFDWWGRPLALAAPGPPGIVHWTYPVPLRIAGWANLYTVHDAIPLTRPDLTPIRERRHRRMLAAIAKGAARLVTVTEAARAEIVAATGCPPGLVVDCGQAALLPEPEPGTPAGLSAGGYFLACGLIEPRKNLAALIEAHARARTGLPLVVCGQEGWHAAPILDAIAQAPGAILLPYQPRAALAALMRDARALLMPSLAEGFGLPVAEAMTLGTPTLISRDPALREVAGGAALEADAADIDAMAAAIARLARDDALRADLSARGLVHAEAHSLDRFAARLGALYASLDGDAA